MMAVLTRRRRLNALIIAEMHKEAAFLVPLRVFIALGWARAGVEKLIAPSWRDGTDLVAYLREHLVAGQVIAPFYERLMSEVFLPNAQALAWVVLVAQLLAGAAILVGAFTNLALLGGLVLNINFVMTGEVNPSAFYVVIQLVLLVAGTGAVLGVDALLSRRIDNPLLVAQNDLTTVSSDRKRRWFAVLSAANLLIALLAATRVRTIAPMFAVEDPGMILVTLFGTGSLSAFIGYLRQRPAAASTGRRPAPPQRSGGQRQRDGRGAAFAAAAAVRPADQPAADGR